MKLDVANNFLTFIAQWNCQNKSIIWLLLKTWISVNDIRKIKKNIYSVLMKLLSLLRNVLATCTSRDADLLFLWLNGLGMSATEDIWTGQTAITRNVCRLTRDNIISYQINCNVCEITFKCRGKCHDISITDFRYKDIDKDMDVSILFVLFSKLLLVKCYCIQ